MKRRLISEHFKSNGRPKQAFASREEAEAERVRAKKAGSYRCKFCRSWHVGGRGV